MVPGVSYLVMIRTNRPYSPWLPFLSVINLDNTNAAFIRISLKTGKSEEAVLFGGQRSRLGGRMHSEAARSVPARMLPQMQFTAGSGEDADGDGLPDLYEDLVTRTDPLSPDTGKPGSRMVTRTRTLTAGAIFKRCRTELILSMDPPPPASNLRSIICDTGEASL